MVTTYENCEAPMTTRIDLKRKAPSEPETDGDYLNTVDEIGIPEAIPYIRGWYFPDVVPPEALDSSHDSDVEEHDGLEVGQSFDAMQYLFPSRHTDYLIRIKEDNNEEKLIAECLKDKRYVFICTFYIPVSHTSVGELCCQLNDIISQLSKERDDSAVVLVTRMRSDFPNYDNDQVADAAFTHFFSAFSPLYLAVPISATARSLNLFRVMGSSRYCEPGCIVVDLEKRELLCPQIYDLLSYGPDIYPFTAERLSAVDMQCNTIRSRNTHVETLLCGHSSDLLECVCNPTSPCGKTESLSSLANKVVWLYFIYDGRFMDDLYKLSRLCKDKGLEFTLVVVLANNFQVRRPTLPSLWRDVVRSRLQNPDCCGWFLLPFDYRVSCRLNVLCTHHSKDKLVVLGPNGSYVEPHGREVYSEYGIAAYPFTKQTVWEKEVARLRGLSLQDWLGGCGILSLKRPNGQILPVSDLRDRDVLVYFGATSSWDDRLLRWVKEMKASSKRGLELIFICLYEVPEGDSSPIKCWEKEVKSGSYKQTTLFPRLCR